MYWAQYVDRHKSACAAVVQEEETTLLPQLAAVLNAETQLQLGIYFEAAKVG